MEPAALKVGVLLDPQPDELGEWLADAMAFEAAGAHSLWVDPLAASRLDSLALAAAVAVVTSRSLLVAALPPPDRPAAVLAGMLATVARLSHGRLAVAAEPARLEELAAQAGAEPELGLEALPAFRRLPSADGEPGGLAYQRQAEPPERWTRTASPEGRAAWRTALEEAAERGADGLLVAWGPRLLDILRNPNDPGDRGDLQLAQG
jgi:alkanesulfonate monooxygenase SsuD/methylene tetrahydromethanopterin reductase-like flavin-dependent oxidoreductase (luciferase family)